MREIGFLFDLDGVLIDSEREYTRIWEEINDVYPTGKEEFALQIKGQTLGKILTENYPDEETRGKVKEMLHTLEQAMKYTYCKGAEEFIDTLKTKGGKMAVVTSSDEVKMKHLYEDVPGFREKINVIIDASKVSRSKPDPEGYLKGALETEVDIRKCAVFEDSVQGVKAGKAAGAYVVGITGTKSRSELLPYSDVVVDELSEIDIEDLSQILRER